MMHILNPQRPRPREERKEGGTKRGRRFKFQIRYRARAGREGEGGRPTFFAAAASPLPNGPDRVKTIQSQRGIGSDKGRKGRGGTGTEGTGERGRGQTNKPAVRVSRFRFCFAPACPLRLFCISLPPVTVIWRRSVPKVVFCNGFTIIACRRQTSATLSRYRSKSEICRCENAEAAILRKAAL